MDELRNMYGQPVRHDRFSIALTREQSHEVRKGEIIEVEDGSEREFLGTLNRIINQIPSLIKHGRDIFKVSKRAGKCFAVTYSPRGELLLSHLRLARFIKERYSDQQLNPCFGLLWQSAMEAGVDKIGDLVFTEEADAMRMADKLNCCVALIRGYGRTSKFENACKGFYRGSRKNNLELLKYLDRLSRVTGRMLICRLDVGYRIVNPAFGDERHSQRPEVLREDRRRLLTFVKKKMGSNFIGFAWKLEYGMKKGFHYHLILVFNGRNLNGDIPIVRMIGEYWAREVTGGGGTYYNCNAFKQSYKSCGIGQYSRTVNPEMWTGIVLMCAYLTKADELVRLRTEGHMRTFGKGKMPKLVSKRGRKSASLSDSDEGTVRPAPLEGRRREFCKEFTVIQRRAKTSEHRSAP